MMEKFQGFDESGDRMDAGDAAPLEEGSIESIRSGQGTCVAHGHLGALPADSGF